MIYIQFTPDGHIRKWSREPFGGAVAYGEVGEPVAWMYECEGKPSQVSLSRWYDIVDGKLACGCGDYTETPLYPGASANNELVGELRANIGILEAALTQIAGSHYERFGIDQTDIEQMPDLSADEAMNLARDTLSAHGTSLVEIGLVQALRSMTDVAHAYGEYITTVPANELERHPYLPGLEDEINAARAHLTQEPKP